MKSDPQSIDDLYKNLHTAKANHDQQEEIIALQALSRFTLQLGNIDEAEKFVETANTLSRKGNFQKELAECYNILGEIANRKGHWKLAIDSWRKSADLSDNLKETAAMMRAIFNSGKLNLLIRNFHEAEIIFKSLLNGAFIVKEDKLIAEILINLAIVYILTDHFKPAKEALDGAKKFLTSAKITEHADYFDAWGDFYYHNGKWKRAEEYYQKALKMKVDAHDTIGECHLLIKLGNIKNISDKCGEAKDILNRALNIAEGTQDIFNKGVILYNLGYSESYMNRESASIELFKAAKDIFQRLGAEDHVGDVDQILDLLLTEGTPA